MKRIISVFISIVLVFSSLCVSSYAADTIRSSVDAKPEGAYNQSSDKLNIKGWAFDSTGEVVRCYYKIDNGAETMVDPVTRRDVVAAFPNACSQLDCGYDQYIPVNNLSFGEHTFLFYAKSGSTVKTLCQVTFSVIGLKTDCNQIPSGSFDVSKGGDFRVIGWAFNSSGERTDCFYQIDNGPEVALPHVNRSDVQAVFDCNQLDTGFNYVIPFSEFTIGTHTLTLIARSGGLSKIVGTSEITVTSSNAYFKYSADANLTGNYTLGSTTPVRVSGWAFNPDGNQVRCYYQIDNSELVLLTPHDRNDVVNAFAGSCTQVDCGYQMDVSISGIGKGVHSYKVIAKSGNVSQVIKETEFIIVDNGGEFKSHSEHIAEGTYNLGSESTVLIKGWGYNTSAEEVKFYGKFDEGREFYLTSEERQDVLSTQSGCYQLDCGYISRIYLGNLTAGTHTFSVVIRSGEKSKVVAQSTFSIIRPEYSVSFNANSGSGVPAKMTKTFGKNLVLPSAVPERPYYVFKGWNTAADGSGEAVEASYKNNADAVLYAMWEHEKIELISGSALRFDEKSNLVYGSELLGMNGEQLKNSFKNTNKTVNASEVVTGTKVSVYDSEGVFGTVQAVILGDINGDGRIDGMDAVVASCTDENLLSKSQLGSAAYSAADCMRDGEINSDDVQKLISAGVFKDYVDQNVVLSRGYYDTDLTVKSGETSENSVMLNGRTAVAQIVSAADSLSLTLNAECDEFNYFGIKYSSTTYAKGTVTYELNSQNYSEEFFLEPDSDGTFCSFIDGVFDGVRSTKLVSVSFVPLNAESLDISVNGISLFNRQVPDTVTYLQNNFIKIGVNMDWGGSLSYYEDLDSDVQAVSDNGIIRVDSNAAQRYGTESLNDSVNLINCHDTGRLVQQSYYGTTNYEMGFFNGHYCAYNPVQGGNMYNESSKIVDLRTDNNTLYIKCRPLDWAKSKEYITESYMEAAYILCDDTLKTSCRFVDFSGYDPATAGQEIPAFYGAATMDKFVYYNGSNPWTDDTLSTLEGLDEYLYAHYPSVYPKEHWGALTGEFDDSFSIGLYIPDSTYMLAGVSGTVTGQTENPDISDPTSYLAGGKSMTFRSFDPIEYDFYITTGTVSDVRNSFKAIAETL